MKAMRDIFVRELERLNEASLLGPLTYNQLRALESLVKSLKSYSENELEEEDELASKSIEELIAIAKGDYEYFDEIHRQGDEEETKPE